MPNYTFEWPVVVSCPDDPDGEADFVTQRVRVVVSAVNADAATAGLQASLAGALRGVTLDLPAITKRDRPARAKPPKT